MLFQNLILIAVFGISTVFSIECYAGLKILKGTSVGTTTIKCDNSAAYCYNMTASAAAVIEVTKAGCSMWRCMLAQNKCISTTFQNIPISLCCCNTPFCNVAENGNVIQPQNTGGWNAEPEHTRTDLTKDEVERRFNSAELDDDHSHQSTRATRFIHEITQNITKEAVQNETLSEEEIKLLL
ncbi:unnamed protein product [Caenorhabditis angaria]|uniref:Activin types I and II receptor domain-containing protein n=1 Tax=Caenorhabditis angaria TaxID=860376 RepID=A0A9P1MT43_9PELO|nr:unnamed protein product [Caenorhabditis angaria]